MIKTYALAATAMLFSSTPGLAQDASEYLIECQKGETVCEAAYNQFKDEFPKAYRRDYQSQRNVAFCLSRDCDGAIAKQPVFGCAWRMVIVASGSPKVGQTDASALKIDCSKLDKIEMQAAISQADALMRKIYKRPLPR